MRGAWVKRSVVVVSNRVRTRHRRGSLAAPNRWTILATAIVAVSTLSACDQPGAADLPVRVGAGSTTEQQVLAALAVEVLQRDEVAAEITPDLGDTVDVRDDALDGRIDVYWDYSGAAWALSLGLPAPPIDPQESFEVVAAEEADNGLTWLGPTQADARLAFFVRAGAVPEGQAGTLSWLAGQLGRTRAALCADEQYLAAASGYSYLVDTYAIAPEQVTTRATGPEEGLNATAAGDCLAALATTTSGLARTLDLVPLTDDLGVFPALVVAPVVVDDGRGARAEVTAALEALAGQLTVGVLADLNAEAVAGTPIDELAVAFLDGASR